MEMHANNKSPGGVQPYLKYIYGDVFGYFAAWTWVLAIMPASIAILSIVFVEVIALVRLTLRPSAQKVACRFLLWEDDLSAARVGRGRGGR